MYCRNCGQEVAPESNFCTHCAHPVADSLVSKPPKNRTLAGLMALFLGFLGLHSFYLGHKERGVTQLVLSTIGGICSCGVATIVMQIWAVSEAVRLFSGHTNTDAKGNPLTE